MNCLSVNCKPSFLDARLLKNVLESIAEILALDPYMGWSRSDSSVAYHFERAGGIDALEECQKNGNYEIYEMSATIIKTYFDLDET